MKTKTILLLITALLGLSFTAGAQSVSDGSYRSLGTIKSDGTVQDGSYRTIGYARVVPVRWAAFYFFFFS